MFVIQCIIPTVAPKVVKGLIVGSLKRMRSQEKGRVSANRRFAD